MSDIATGRAAVTKRVLEGDGHASRDDRKAAYAGTGPVSVAPLIEKVGKAAAKISDDDIAAAKAKGLSEDQIFELVVCAAIGESTRQYEGALAALAAATESK